MVWFRENWYEELLRQLNEGLIMCQAAAFASRADGKSVSQSVILLLLVVMDFVWQDTIF